MGGEQACFSTDTISADPLFVDPLDPDGADDIWGTADDGLQLRFGSPSINTGQHQANITPTDLIGNLRPQLNGWDMGAYEFAALSTITFASKSSTIKESSVMNEEILIRLDIHKGQALEQEVTVQVIDTQTGTASTGPRLFPGFLPHHYLSCRLHGWFHPTDSPAINP